MRKNNFTLVTGLWDLGRGNLEGFTRSFDHYLECFGKLLSLDCNMVVWVPEELNRFVHMNRNMAQTKIINKELSDFDTWFPWYDQTQETRKLLSWRERAAWLENAPQSRLQYYNPVVMSKFFMLNDSAIFNPFNTEYYYWIDAGLTNTVQLELLKNTDRLPQYMQELEKKDFLFLSYPYENDVEVHGFESDKFNRLCGVDKSNYVCRGGFFGGHRKAIQELNGDYYGIGSECFRERCMGTEENFNTILSHRFKDRIHRFELEENGLVYSFFEHLGKLPKVPVTNNSTLIPYDKKKDIENIKTSLYILTYNSPEQFANVAQTWLDNGFDKCHRRILVDNSTNPSTYERYQELCKWYYFEHIKKEENIGICGGRQFIAEHFNESDSEYYIFIEDDMHLNYPTLEVDKFGYPMYVDNLYEKSINIIHQNRYDYLKLTYCEFFGDNSVQWAWYNVPQTVRELYFPDKPNLPTQGGLDDDAPKTEPRVEKRLKDLHYFDGDYHYCNWPIWVSREGNRKIFLDTKWDRPYEQTWMSHVFQLQKKGDIKSAVLKLSPITHDRFQHYPGEERIES